MIQWPEEIYTETNIDLLNTTQNIQQKNGDLNDSFLMITMYMYLFNRGGIMDIIFVTFCLDLFIE
jgi:hypothetical protein